MDTDDDFQSKPAKRRLKGKEEVVNIPALVIRRKGNGTEDKKQREQDKRLKQKEIEDLSFSSNIDSEECKKDAGKGILYVKGIAANKHGVRQM